MASENITREDQLAEDVAGTPVEHPENQEEGRRVAPGTGNPGLPVASLIFAVAAAILFAVVSWLYCCVAAGVAIVLGVLAHKQGSPRLGIAKAGIALGAVCIVVALALVGTVVYQFSRLA